MGFDKNEIIIIGRLTHEVESKISNAGNPYVKMSIANNSGDKVNYFKVMVFGKRGETCINWLTKGSQICVSSMMSMNDFEGEQGEKVRTWTILANHIQFLSKLKEQDTEESESEKEIPEEAIPF